MRKTFALATLVATLALAPAIAGDTKDGYGWTFTKGEKARYAYAYNLEQKLEIMGMPQIVKQEARLELTEETTEVKGDSATVTATIDRVVIDLSYPPMMGGNGKLAIDTAKAEEKKDEDKKDKKDDKKKKDDDDDDAPGGMGAGGKNPLDAVRVAVGAKFTFKIAKDGLISEVSGLDEIATKINEKLGAAPGTFALLDSEILQQTLDLHCHIFPAGGASGDSWEIPTTMTLPSLGQLSFKRTITPKGEAEGGLKLVETASKCEVTPREKGVGAPNPMMAMLGKPKIKDPGFDGKATFSREKGRVVSDELTAKLTTDFQVANPMGGNDKKKAGDDDDDDDAPKKDKDKKDEKKDDKKKDDEEGGGEGKMKLSQAFKLVLKYELLTGAPEKSDKKDEKKDF